MAVAAHYALYEQIVANDEYVIEMYAIAFTAFANPMSATKCAAARMSIHR